MILETDIKLMQSERLQDTDDGGGRMTGNDVVDGLSNNLFPDISELDRTYGRISLRKVFPAVLTDTVDTYYGANVMVAKPPQDPLVHVTLFKTGDSAAWFNERLTAQNKIESYVALGVLSNMRMLGDHYEGQRSLLAYQDTGSAIPAAGEVFALVAGSILQYVRISDVSHEIVTYTDSLGGFQRRQLMMTLGDALRYNFTGGEPNRSSAYQPPTKIYKTNTVEAVSYYGVVGLAQAVDFGAMQIRVEDYKRPLLPSTQSESALLDIQAGGTRTLTLSGGARSVSLSNVSHTAITRVTSLTRQYNYVNMLWPLPAPGTLEISYRSRDRWYTVADELGTGSLTGDGSGHIEYATGSVAVTLKDLPDADTAILWAWSSQAHYNVRTLADVLAYRWEGVTANAPVVPGSVSIEWEYPAGQVKRATDDGTGGLTGDGTGSINYATGRFNLAPASIPAPGTTPQISYDYGDRVTEHLSVSVAGDGLVVLSAAQQITPRSLSVEWVVERSWTRYESGGYSSTSKVFYNTYAATEETQMSGYAVVRVSASDNGQGVLNHGGGTVNYVTGEIQFNTTVPAVQEVTKHSCSYGSGDGGAVWETEEVLGLPADPVAVTLRYLAEGGTSTSATETLSDLPIVINLTPYTSDTIVPGSVQFTIGSTTYIDRDGAVYRGVDPATGAGTWSGTVDYASGICILSDWTPGGGAFSLQSLLTVRGHWTEAFMRFRTPGAPLRPAGFYVAATDVQGRLIMASADIQGVVSGDHIEGSIDVKTGVVELKFGDLVSDASLTPEEKQEPWYDPADVDQNDNIWRPIEVFPQTVRYNCVVYVYLPLSADILGLDPVRLPMDGRVPIFRVGDVVVLHHTRSTSIGSPANGQVIDTGRLRLAYARLYDSTNAPVPTERYSVDLDAGTVTMLDVSGLATPLRLEDRIEDMALVSDLQINGTLTLTRSISHSYPVDGSYVSSALVIGDLFARVAKAFSQATWTGVWSDELIGSGTTAKYNTTVYPIEVTNRGAIQERWILKFKNATEFDCIGEYSGQIASGGINQDFAPVNPETATPYFTLRAAGWGSGWATGNVLRFNTVAANFPVWIARTVLQGDASAHEDHFRIQVRGDADTP